MDDPNRAVLIVNLSGDQKKVLGLASWTQVAIVGSAAFLGMVFFQLVEKLFKFMGAGTGVSILAGLAVAILLIAPAAWFAFKPIRDKNGNILYYRYKQLLIDHYASEEVGTYINYVPHNHPVNHDKTYIPKYR